MKKYFAFYLLVISMFFGCATVKPERNVVDNTFFSSSPKIEVKISSSFRYLGDIKHSSYEFSVGPDVMRNRQDVHVFIFFVPDGSLMKKGLWIQVENLTGPGAYFSIQERHIKNKLDFGTCELGGKEFKYFSQVGRFSLEGQPAKYILDNGYRLPDVVLLRNMARVVGHHGNTLLHFIYFEDLDVTMRRKGHIDYLPDFIKNCEDSFSVTKCGF